MKRPLPVVIDTSRVLSALVFAGGRLAWQAQRVLPFVSCAAAESIRPV